MTAFRSPTVLCRPTLLATTMVAMGLAACGGDGGAGEGRPAGTSTPTPTVSASLSGAKSAPGKGVTLSWSSKDADSCSVVEASAASLPASGSLTVTPSQSGRHVYTVKCAGAGGSAAQAVTLVVPMPVAATGYDNKNSIPFDETRVPTVRALGIAPVVPTEQDTVDRSVAFGDFFQEGSYAAYVMAGNSDGRYGADKPGNLPGIGYFLARDESGRWVDRSAELFRTTADRMGCISPSYSSVADFNHDGRPDVYVACTGLDFAVPGATEAENQAYGRSYQILVLSQPDGSYVSKRIEEANPIYGHKAVAFDVDRDGHVDVVTTDFIDPAQPNGCGAPYALRGRGDGTFVRDYTLIDGNALRSALPDCGMFNVDMVPIAGQQDLVVGGIGRDGSGTGIWVALWVKGSGPGFDFTTPVALTMPIEPLSAVQAHYALDVLHDATTSSFLFKTTAVTSEGNRWLIVKSDHAGHMSILDTWLNRTADLQPTSPQFKPSYADPGVLLPYTGGCAADVTLGACGQRVRVR